jgi:hypothetical protein
MADIDIHYNDGLVLRSIVDDVVPEHISHNYPGLMAAVKSYADFLEHTNNAGHFLNTIDAQRDIDRIEEGLIYQLQKEIGATIPQQFSADPRLLYKRVTEFYRSRGTPDSIRAFFRILFNDDVELYFPKEDMLIPSDGKFYDRTDDVKANPDLYTPTFTFTLSADGDTISGNDDSGRTLIYDNPVIFVNNTLNTEWQSKVVVNNTTNKLDYSVVFDNELSSGDIIQIYSSGSFSNNDGFLDNYKRIQDSYFYQKFSYVLRTGANTDQWKNAFNRLVHPAGFIFFGEILLFLDNLGQTFPFIQPGFQTGGLPFPIIIPVTDASSSFVKALDDVVASMVVVSFKQEAPSLTLGAADHYDHLKFRYSATPIANLGEYTVQDVINKRVKYNINSVIEIS